MAKLDNQNCCGLINRAKKIQEQKESQAVITDLLCNQVTGPFKYDLIFKEN